jgi:hypothetical protein
MVESMKMLLSAPLVALASGLKPLLRITSKGKPVGVSVFDPGGDEA